jgi:hypothetical protein
LSREHYTNYDDAATTRCERALVTLLGDLGPWSERIYLAGGLAPRYLVGRLPDGARAHVGTTDVDLVIGLARVPGLDTSVWQISTGVQLENFQDPFGGWSDDSQLVLTSEGGGDPARSWSCDLCIGPQALRQLARTRVTRGFTAGERAKYLTQ